MPTDPQAGGRSLTELRGEELERADEIYASIRFEPSNPSTDRTFALVEEGQILGLGRIQKHAGGELEVGGFWIDPARRGVGLARIVVEQILSRVPAGRSAWCIPFEHLADFYRSFGMRDVDPDSAPGSVLDKLEHCRQLHEAGELAPVRLLRYSSPE